MVLAVFRTRMDPDNLEEYGRLAQEMSNLAQTMPGYISHKGYGAEDG
jgi:antibiotic biosynthesis monooxygenase (ABM) superfamily enzyme